MHARTHERTNERTLARTQKNKRKNHVHESGGKHHIAGRQIAQSWIWAPQSDWLWAAGFSYYCLRFEHLADDLADAMALLGHGENEVAAVRLGFGGSGGSRRGRWSGSSSSSSGGGGGGGDSSPTGNTTSTPTIINNNKNKKNKRWNSSPQGGKGNAPDYSHEIATRLTPAHRDFIHNFYADDLWAWRGCKDHNARPFVFAGPRGEVGAVE